MKCLYIVIPPPVRYVPSGAINPKQVLIQTRESETGASLQDRVAGLVVNYGISNTIVLEIP